jgi:hypothetical protein
VRVAVMEGVIDLALFFQVFEWFWVNFTF